MAGNTSPQRSAQRPQTAQPEQSIEVADMPVPRMSPSIARFAPAFVRVQAALQPVIKNHTNPAFKGDRPVTYADLASILEEALPILSANGFGLMQFPSTENGQLALMSMLIHESGEFVSATMPLLLQKADPQGEGSAISYGRRYAACAILGIRTVDDDGNEASNRQVRQTQEPTPPREKSKEEALGWASPDACKAAHDAVIAQIRSLPPEADRTALNEHRSAKGMPMSPDDLTALSVLVAQAAASAGQEAPPAADPAEPQPDAPAPAPGPPSAPSEAPGEEMPWDNVPTVEQERARLLANKPICPWCEKPVIGPKVITGGTGPDDPALHWHKNCRTEWEAEQAPPPEEEGA